MNILPVFAEDISPAILPIFLVPLLLGLLALRFITASRRAGGKSRAGLIVRLVPVLIGGVILFFLLTIRGGAPAFFIVVAAFPVAAGLLSLYLYVRGPKSPERSSRAIKYAKFRLAFAIATALVISNGFHHGWDASHMILLAAVVGLGVFGVVVLTRQNRIIQKLRTMPPEEQDKFLAGFDEKTQAKLRKQLET
jgi:hypothetical protein